MINILDIIYVSINLLFDTDGSAGRGSAGWRLELTDMYCRNKGIRPRVYVIRIVSHLDLRLSTSADPCALVLYVLPLTDTVLNYCSMECR